MRLPPFQLHRPETLQEAVSLLAQHGEEARPIAGGTAMVPMMRFGFLRPDHVVSLKGIPGLDGLLLSGDFPTGVPLYIDVSGGPPAQRSGVGPFAELILVDVDGTGLPVDLLEIINDTRDANGISDSNRADLRWSLGIDGRVFLTNKKDGVIRELVHLLPGDFD